MMSTSNFRLLYYPWITQNVDATLIDREVQRFAITLQETLKAAAGNSFTVQVLNPVDVPKQVEIIANGGCEIALMNPLGYVFARRRNPLVASVAIAQRIIDGQVGDTYYAQVYTSKLTAIRTIYQLRNRSIGYGTPYSTSNFLIPALEIKNKGLHPFTAFSRIEFLGGHDLVAKAVYDGKIDIGAGHDGVIIDLSNQYGYGDAVGKLSTIIRSAPIPSDPVVVNVSDNAVLTLLQTSLIKTAITPDGRQSLAMFWGNAQGLSPASADAYNALEKALDELGLDEVDLLRKNS